MDMCTPLYLKWVTNKDLLYSIQNSVQSYVAWMGGEFGGEQIHIYVWLSPFTVHLKLLQLRLLIGYVCVHVLSRFSHVRLSDPMDHSPPGSSVHGILQARILEGVTMPSSRGSS